MRVCGPEGLVVGGALVIVGGAVAWAFGLLVVLLVGGLVVSAGLGWMAAP